jgi:predicted secreted acid phosphatase/endonuclease/exonuclease/phosphatase family metal-dependent hydrolase
MSKPSRFHLQCWAILSLVVIGCSTESTKPTTGGSESGALPMEVPVSITFATWNVEHLAFPASDGCRPRTEQEVAAMRAYAANLGADVVALQEVASIPALEQVFPQEEWQLFLSERADSESYTCRTGGQNSTQQKTAFAVSKDIDVLQHRSLEELGLDDPGLRHGLELTLETPTGTFTVLNVHLKSGCFVDDYSRSDSEDCQLFMRQTPILDAWVEEKEREDNPFLVLGDFNHRISAPYNSLTRLLTDNSDGSVSSLRNATAGLIGCHPYYPAPIDHILVGNLGSPMWQWTPAVHAFEDMNPDTMRSDHCAVSITLGLGSLPLSTAVTWQTESKEYRFLTTTIYEEAAADLQSMTLPATPWVVTMDIDETVLDNSAYQVVLDRTGSTYTSATWATWVESEEAVLVPGAAGFIETVFALGGRVAFVTNRNRSLDDHTWNNLLALGLPLTLENACLLGRSPADAASINGSTVINDKDLRRRQVRDGTASCFKSGNERHSAFPAATIVMQVGDNIEDFEGVTQESANVEALRTSTDKVNVLLPNPMYGSW